MVATLVEPARQDPDELARRAKAQTNVRWELLDGMVRRDLKLKYQNSALGFVWSLINPLFYLVVYGVIFGVLLKNGVPEFPLYLMSGLLLWNVFAGGVMGGATSVVGSAGLVRKVRFPLAVLPLAQVGFALVHYVLQMGVFLVVVIVYDLYSGSNSFGVQNLLFFPGVIIAVTFTVGMSFLVSALNVRYRDTAHLLELLMFAWFWGASIIYASGLVTEKVRGTVITPRRLTSRIFFSDPIATAVAFMHRAFTNDAYAKAGNKTDVLPASSYTWYAEEFGIAMVISLALLWYSKRLFDRWSANFAEEL